MAAAEDLGKKVLLPDISTSGLIVQDVQEKADGGVVRQVIFEANHDQVQSEVRMVYRDPTKHTIPEKWLANSELCPAKKGKVAILDLDWICGEYANTMLSGLHRVPSLGKRKVKILVLGTGAGNLPMFL